MRSSLAALILIWLCVLSLWPERAGRQAHLTWKSIVAGWEQVQ